MDFLKIIVIIFLTSLIWGLAAEDLHKEAFDLPETFDNWVKCLAAADADTLCFSKIRSEALFLKENSNSPASLDISRRGFLLLETATDSLQAEAVKNKLLSEFPKSRETYDLANEEFYEFIYPVWNNDSLKVEIIFNLLKKYSETGWRRTMYQYLFYSLDQTGNDHELKERLSEFRNAFSQDYLPWLLSVRYLDAENTDTVELISFAQKALDLSYDYPYVEFYPEMEWQLEARSAPVKAAAALAEVLINNAMYNAAIDTLQEIITENPLTMEDETTLGRCYYLLAKAYTELEMNDLAEDFAIQALIAGDSRNYYSPRADTLLTNLLAKHRGFNPNLSYSRKIMNYQDVRFSDVTDEMGLGKIRAGRIAWGDYNNDGWQDFLLNGSRLFRNLSGSGFEEVTDSAFPDTIRGNGGLWGDIDNDGDLDVVTKDPESLWMNKNGVFYRDPDFLDNGISTEGMSLGDVNKDGYLDLYLANYENNYVYEADQFFPGSENGFITDSAGEYGLIPEDKINRAGRGVNFADFDNDGDQDIFVSNYRLTENFLWQNDGTGYFNQAAREYGVSGVEVEGWWGHTIGSEWGDIDNDGDLDLISCNLAHPRYIDFSDKTMLLINSGFPDFTFSDHRVASGIRFEETHSEPALGDLNNDGFLDLFINDIYEGRRSFLYMSNGDLTFREVTYLSGTRHYNGWGVAFADYDNDGDLDILAAGGEIQLFRNDSYDLGNWLQIEIIGKDHCDAIGTRLILKNDNISLIREIQGGKGTTNQHSFVQHFGLGQEDAPFELTIRFPNGAIKQIEIEEINRKVIVKE